MTISPDSAKTHVLTLLTGSEEREITLPEGAIADALGIIEKMDADMSNGCQLSRRFIDKPNRTERCQIVANRLLTSLHTQNEAMASLMAAYLITRMPEIRTAAINTEGEADETLFYDTQNTVIE